MEMEKEIFTEELLANKAVRSWKERLLVTPLRVYSVTAVIWTCEGRIPHTAATALWKAIAARSSARKASLEQELATYRDCQCRYDIRWDRKEGLVTV
jgi:hypothetical protein